MKTLTNGLVLWEEKEILFRDQLCERLLQEVRSTLYLINPIIQVIRVETPCLIEQEAREDLPLYNVDTRYSLRGESTKGTYQAQDMLQHKLPVCLYQINKSFRDEKSDAIRISKYRLREFYQMEFQLFYSQDTKADYHQLFIEKFSKEFGQPVEADKPPYSTRTTDLEINGIEVASFSTRKDYTLPVFEMSFGIDRYVLIK